ncbi:MAG: M3 family oligoendopeptidase [Bacteroidetes bacterium]|nr:M3 family oligoendopeptidase [Bacteroidota bacterium]
MQEIKLIDVKERQYLPQDFNVESWEQLEKIYTDLANRDISTFEKFEKWIKDWDEFDAVASEDFRWKYIKTSVNTADVAAQQAVSKYYTEIDPKTKPWNHKLRLKFNESPFKNSLNKSYLNFIRAIEADLAIYTEKNIEVEKELNLLTQQFDQITGIWSITYNGKELTFPQASKMLLSTDRKVRQEVYTLMQERKFQDRDKLDELMDKLVAKRHELATNAGFENYRDYAFKAMHRFDYSAKDCMNFHQSVANQIIPIIRKFQLERKNFLGYTELKPWDLKVDPINREPLKPFENTEDFVNKTVECFNQLDVYFGTAIAEMNEMGRLDLESRKAKAPGGYMMPMPESGVPFIFMNHAAAEGDVRVMVHEGGHAVHGFLAHDIELASMRTTPSEMSELASMGMELLALENWENFYPNQEDLNRAKKNHLEGLLGTLVGVAQGDEFQHWMYTHPTHTASERNAKWEELLDKYSIGVINYEGVEKYLPTSYQRILHFYQVPFYYIEYGFAQLGAIALWKNYKSNPMETIAEYKNALSFGYTKTLPELYEEAGIKFNFSEDYVKELAVFLNKEIEKL